MLTIFSSLPTIIGLLIISLSLCQASVGDQYFKFRKCLASCVQSNCDSRSVTVSSNGQASASGPSREPSALDVFYEHQPFWEWAFYWTCTDECQYQCMWVTVEAMYKDGSPVQQFYGKWPFIRFFGIQEPASVLFSLFNIIAIVVAMRRYRALVPKCAPLRSLWHLYAFVACITWLCAIVFHCRDRPITEKMDYFSAASYIIFGLFCFIARVVGTRGWARRLVLALAAEALSGYLAYHVWRLSGPRFDYDFNMFALVVLASAQCMGWFAWCNWMRRGEQSARGRQFDAELEEYLRNEADKNDKKQNDEDTKEDKKKKDEKEEGKPNKRRGKKAANSAKAAEPAKSSSSSKGDSSSASASASTSASASAKQPIHSTAYVNKCIVFVVATALVFSLEALDFVPFLWTVDAHSLWHLATALLAPIFYSFLVDDACYCVRSMEERARFSCHPGAHSCAHCAQFLARWQAIDDEAAAKAKANLEASVRDAQAGEESDAAGSQEESEAGAQNNSQNAKH